MPRPNRELVRNLSMFVSCLEWVVPPDHTAQPLCERARSGLSRIIDSLLGQYDGMALAAALESHCPPAAQDLQEMFSPHDMSWLETVDWAELSSGTNMTD